MSLLLQELSLALVLATDSQRPATNLAGEFKETVRLQSEARRREGSVERRREDLFYKEPWEVLFQDMNEGKHGKAFHFQLIYFKCCSANIPSSE